MWYICKTILYFYLFCVVCTAESLASDHTNNWAVLVGSSKFWFNYRHAANTLGIYRSVKRLGIPDSNIILMLADDVACDPRNSFAGSVYSSSDKDLDLYGEHIEVDYRGSEVTVENFIRLLTGRLDDSYPRSKRLDTDENSNILVYMTGHGGDEFLKFQDYEEISAYDLADAFEQMHQKKRYNEILYMIDTCQANTMYSKIYSPNILATGCSEKDQNSYSHHSDKDIGIAVIDRFTRYILRFLEGVNKTSTSTLQDMFDGYDPVEFRATPGVRKDLYNRDVSDVLVTDFFGGVSSVEMSNSMDSLLNSNLSSTISKRKRNNNKKSSINIGDDDYSSSLDQAQQDQAEPHLINLLRSRFDYSTPKERSLFIGCFILGVHVVFKIVSSLVSLIPS